MKMKMVLLLVVLVVFLRVMGLQFQTLLTVVVILIVTSRLSKCSHRKGENDNDQILTRPSCAYLLGNYSRSGEGPQSYLMTLQIFSLGGVFDNVQISTTLRCAYLLVNPREHVPRGGILDTG